MVESKGGAHMYIVRMRRACLLSAGGELYTKNSNLNTAIMMMISGFVTVEK